MHIFGMEIQNARATRGKLNQLLDVMSYNRSLGISPLDQEIEGTKSKVIEFVVNASMNVPVNNFTTLKIQGTC